MIEIDTQGYNLFPKTRPESPGYPRVDVVFRRAPTEAHFDPERLRLSVASRDGDIRLVTVRHPWRREPRAFQLVAGRALLEDRVEKRVEFFTLGGEALITDEEDATVCQLVSPAPIIQLSAMRSTQELLAEEIEAALARRRARWEPCPRDFEKRLIAANPLVLYAACLVSIRVAFSQMPGDTLDELAHHFIRFLRDEIAAIQALVGRDIGGLSIEDII